MQVEQYVMAYEVEQDRLRALLPAGFVSLRPVLRINGEIRRGPEETAYLELNTPVEGHGKRGWLNVGHWDSRTAELSYAREGKGFALRNRGDENARQRKTSAAGCESFKAGPHKPFRHNQR